MRRGLLVTCFIFCFGALILCGGVAIIGGLEGSILQLKTQVSYLNSKIDEHGEALFYLHQELEKKVQQHADALMSLHGEDVYVDSVVKPQ